MERYKPIVTPWNIEGDMLSLAQATTDANAWLPTLGAVASTGFTVWYAYYTITQTIPGLMKDHKNERDEWKADWKVSTDKHTEAMTALTLATNELNRAVKDLLSRSDRHT